MRKFRSIKATMVTLVAISTLFVPFFMGTAAATGVGGTAVHGDVVGYIAPWDGASGYDSVLNNESTFTDVSISAKTIDPASPGSVVDVVANPVDFTKKATLQAANIGVEVLISNLVSGSFSQSAAEAILNSSTARSTFVTNAVNIAVNDGYDGVELDFENLVAADRTNFTALVTSLNTALHAVGKYSFVSVYAKSTDSPSGYGTQQAQDWVAIGNIVDQVRIQGYGYCWASGCIGGSAPGTTSPDFWLNSTLTYAVTAMAKNKIVLGLPLYGTDWANGTNGVDLTWQNDGTSNPDVLSTLSAHGNPTIQWQQTNTNGVVGSSYFDYTSGGVSHEVRFANQYTVQGQIQLGNAYGICGYAFWRLGGEDPSVWSMVRSTFPATDTTSPTAAWNGPVQGSTLSKASNPTVTFYVSASDTLGTLTKVKYYVDGTLVDTQYNKGLNEGLNWTGWNITGVSNGSHTLKLTVFDQAGNTTDKTITVSVTS